MLIKELEYEEYDCGEVVAGAGEALGDEADREPRGAKDGERRQARNRGFTLIEIMVVMAIVGMLAAMVGPDIIRRFSSAQVKGARFQIASFSTSLDAMALDTGRYPSTSEGLEALLQQPSGMNMWDGPYMKKLPKDPWGNDYQYTGPSSGSDFEIVSLGADGRSGGDDDNADISSND